MSAQPLPNPLVSLGVPVYNGEESIGKSLQSLVEQDYPAMEIIVCDNASNDDTGQIVKELAEKTPKLKYRFFDKKVSIKNSYKRALESRRGKYFMFAPADDSWAPDFLSRAVAFLEAHQDYVGCCGRIKLLDEQGNLLEDSIGTAPVEGVAPGRVSDALILTHDASRIYGLLRSEWLDNLIPDSEPPGWDHYTTTKLLLRGKFGRIDSLAMYRQKTPWEGYAGLVTRQHKGFWRRAFYRQDVLKLFDRDPVFSSMGFRWRLARLHFLIKGAYSIGIHQKHRPVILFLRAVVIIMEGLYRLLYGRPGSKR